jgi:hypothetical protein
MKKGPHRVRPAASFDADLQHKFGERDCVPRGGKSIGPTRLSRSASSTNAYGLAPRVRPEVANPMTGSGVTRRRELRFVTSADYASLIRPTDLVAAGVASVARRERTAIRGFGDPASLSPRLPLRSVRATTDPTYGLSLCIQGRGTMIDRYTKLVLTVIAVALVSLVIQRALEPAVADNASCGVERPCKVANFYWDSAGLQWKPCYAGDRACFVVVSNKPN